jgi:hypothetical protein
MNLDFAQDLTGSFFRLWVLFIPRISIIQSGLFLGSAAILGELLQHGL